MKRAFTLAEIIIVLTIIGLLSAILLPSAIKSRPKEDIMKFKKTNSVIAQVIGDLATSGRYFYMHDLGKLPNHIEIAEVEDIPHQQRLITALNESPTDTKAEKYFCNALAEILATKENNCQATGYEDEPYASVVDPDSPTNASDLDGMKVKLDEICLAAKDSITKGYEILTTDGVQWYQASPQMTFGTLDSDQLRYFADPKAKGKPKYHDSKGFDANYKVLCIDIDGDKEDPPFGYGIRVDGKVVLGAQAEEWLHKSLSETKDDSK